MMRSMVFLMCSLAALQSAVAATASDVTGLWRSADGQAIIEFKACPDAPSAICGTLVWETTADKADTSCGVHIAKLKSFDGEAWRDGWVYDPRNNKYYKGVVRTNEKGLLIRAYIGTEMLGETEQLTREASLPTAPVCKK
ncbi:hypothetical protein WM40_12150 [Robbsia andropogonis]|uniref:DUF2147 domain-containing protein n=3 Tax=Robbsia andropogonis TaxID=28092 RepID=A0A0F5K011_9BURK|nr:DUF2147 domain-containing protein [Robbsia andropogonis]KKB63260.1 hypothetical protein WM40_12150 [Robbsia andropogonis]